MSLFNVQFPFIKLWLYPSPVTKTDLSWEKKKKPSRFEEGLPICFPCWVSANLKPSPRPFPAVLTAAALSNTSHIKRPLSHWVQHMWPITPWNVKMSRCADVADAHLQENKTDIWTHMNDKYMYQSKFVKIPLYSITSFWIQVLNVMLWKAPTERS